MGASEEKRDPGRFDPLTPADPEKPYPSPIVVNRGGGSYVRLPISNAVVEGLGGSALLRDRLGAILASEPQLSAGITPHAAAMLTSQYDEFFDHLATITAGPNPSPIKINPRGGWSVTIPIPEVIVEGLGGSAQLRDRLGAILASEPQLSAGVTPHTAATLTSQYDRLLGQCETIITRPGP